MWEMLKGGIKASKTLALGVASILPMWEMLNLLEKLKGAED
jgi:hypothetical protein